MLLRVSAWTQPSSSAASLRSQIVAGKVRHVFEADIRGYFTRINHDWLRKMVAHRIADPVILSLVGKWLRAGVMQDGVVIRRRGGDAARRSDKPRARQYLPALRARPVVREEVQTACRGRPIWFGSPTISWCAFSIRRDAERLRPRTDGSGWQKFGLELGQRRPACSSLGGLHARHGRCTTGRSRRRSSFWASNTYAAWTDGASSQWSVFPQHEELQEVSGPHPRMAREAHALEAAGPASASDDDAAGLLSVLRPAPLRAEARAGCSTQVQRQWIRALRRRGQRHRLFWSYLIGPPGSSCHARRRSIRRSDEAHGANVALGSPVREICTPGSAGGGRYKARPRPPSTQREDPDGLKTYYYLLQIAHTMLQVLERGSLLHHLAAGAGKTPVQLFGSLKNIARRLLEDFRHARLDDDAPEQIQIRLDTS